MKRLASIILLLMGYSGPAHASFAWYCGPNGGTTYVEFYSENDLLGGVTDVVIGNKPWKRYPPHKQWDHFPMTARHHRVGNDRVKVDYFDKSSGAQVMTMTFYGVLANQPFGDHGVMTIANEGTWNFRCSDGS